MSEAVEAATLEVAIQGELGSNSHMAALAVLGELAEGAARIVPCATAADLFEWLVEETGGSTARRMAVLPIENSLHGAVFEHYDLLLEHAVRVTGETLLHIRHNVIAMPGVRLEEIRQVRSHPVALSQCRVWLRAHPEIEVMPFYDTAGSVKRLMAEGLREVAGIAPELAARQYGANVIVPAIEDHAANYTRFLVLVPAPAVASEGVAPDKVSVAFHLEHRPGTLLEALEVFRDGGLNLTKIESRPVPGKPWEYVFFLDVRFDHLAQAEDALGLLRRRCLSLKEFGRYKAADRLEK